MDEERLQLIHLEGSGTFDMPYTPAIKVLSGFPLYLAGVTAAPVYHSHPHIAEEFDGIPSDPGLQAERTMDNLAAVLEAAGGDFGDVVEITRYIVNIERNQDAVNRVLGARLGSHRPATTTVEVSRLATDHRLVLELKAVAVIGG